MLPDAPDNPWLFATQKTSSTAHTKHLVGPGFEGQEITSATSLASGVHSEARDGAELPFVFAKLALAPEFTGKQLLDIELVVGRVEGDS